MTFIEHWLEAFWAGMAVHLWQSALFIVVLAGVARLLHNASARVLAALHWVGVVKLLLPLPLLGPVSDRIVSTAANAASSGGGADNMGWSTVTVLMYPPAFDQVSSTAASPIVLATATAVWLLVAAGVLWKGRGWQRSRRTEQRLRIDQCPAKTRVTLAAALIDTDLRNEDVRVSSGIGPVVEGLLRSKVVLPDSVIENLGVDELRAVLIHEREHLHRLDPLRYALLRAVRTTLWFYPPMWWLARRIRETTEMACDEAVVRAGLPAATYCRSLARTLSLGLSRGAAVSPVGIFGHRLSFLQRRLERIRSGRRFESMAAHRITLIAVAVAALVVSLLPVAPTVPQIQAATPSAAGELDRLADADLPVQLDFNQVKVSKLLEALSKTSGVEFRVVGDLGDRHASITLSKMALADALEQVGLIAGLKFEVVDPRTVEVYPVALAGQDGVTLPKLIPESKVNPRYPETARQEGLGGRVILQAVVDQYGAVGNLEVLTSDPEDYQPFIDSAVEAIEQWRYEPATKDGLPVDVYFTIRIDFRLDNDSKPTPISYLETGRAEERA